MQILDFWGGTTRRHEKYSLCLDLGGVARRALLVLDVHVLPVFSLEPIDYRPLIFYHCKPVKWRVLVVDF